MPEDTERDVDAAEVEGDEDEDWSEPVDVSGLPDGSTTLIVGGFSAFATPADALASVKYPTDQLLLLRGEYEGDLCVDSTVHKGVLVAGDATAAPGDVVVRGALRIAYSEPGNNANAEAAAAEVAAAAEAAAAEAEADGGAGGDGEDGGAGGGASRSRGRKKKDVAPKVLTVRRLSFLSGAVFAEQTDADVAECVFGTAAGVPAVPRAVRCGGFSTVRVTRCTVFGSGLSAVYCFPASRVRFEGCDITGSEKPAAQGADARKKPKRGYVPPPPPPPTAPAKCECEVGAQCDNSRAVFLDCRFTNFGIGALVADASKGHTFDRCAFSRLATVGVLFDSGARATMRSSTVKLCGREALVVGAGAHPTLRDNTFVGNVRLKAGAEVTGATDNIVALNGTVFDEGSLFDVKGFTVVSTDPTLVKPKKVKTEE